MSKIGRKAIKFKNDPTNPLHTKSAKAKKEYNKAIEYNKKHHWRDWLEKANDPDIWTAHRYISALASDGSASRIPGLTATHNGMEVIANINEDKSLMLRAFFPKKPLIENTLTSEQTYADPVYRMDNITRNQIRRHLEKLKPYKAPGPDTISNIVLTKCADILIHRLYYIYLAILKLDIYYNPWKRFTMVVL